MAASSSGVITSSTSSSSLSSNINTSGNGGVPIVNKIIPTSTLAEQLSTLSAQRAARPTSLIRRDPITALASTPPRLSLVDVTGHVATLVPQSVEAKEWNTLAIALTQAGAPHYLITCQLLEILLHHLSMCEPTCQCQVSGFLENMLVGEDVEVFRQPRPSFWVTGTIVRVDRVDPRAAASPVVQIYAESRCDDGPMEGGWFRVADHTVRSLRNKSNDMKLASTPCLPLFYRAFFLAKGPEAVLQLLEQSYIDAKEEADVSPVLFFPSQTCLSPLLKLTC
jgi:hypothetical protein